LNKVLGLVVVTSALVATTYLLRDELASVTERPVPAALSSSGTADRAELERLIRAYEQRVAANPTALQYTFLGRLHLQRGKLTGDLGAYDRAETVLRASLDLFPDDVEARTLLATARYTVHDFDGAIELASELPDDLGALAVVGDASLELGRYDVAANVYDRLTQALPGVAAVDARRSRLAFLRGDIRSAEQFAERAADEARAEGAFGPALAQYHVVLSTLAFERGAYDRAVTEATIALGVADGWHVALTALGRARAAQGRMTEAIDAYRSAIAAVPEPATVAALGDLLAVTGDDAAAQEQYDTVDVIGRLSGVHDRAVALHHADRGRVTGTPVLDRGDVYGHDALAWSLLAAGEPARARVESDRARALGTRDARLLYHAGMISVALGDDERAVDELRAALELSPAFDPLHAPKARATLAALS
jgi:tetratricopeptide (TPR) repeat protein